LPLIKQPTHRWQDPSSAYFQQPWVRQQVAVSQHLQVFVRAAEVEYYHQIKVVEHYPIMTELEEVEHKIIVATRSFKWHLYLGDLADHVN
jgi:acyl-CoA thioesterase FadM